MKKFLNLLLIFALSLAMVFTLSACNNNEEDSSSASVETGVTYDIETEDGEKYAIVKSFALSDEDTEKVTKNNYADIMQSLTINEYVKDGVTYPVKKVDAGAFANQVVIEKVVFGSNVEEIGAGCLAGCSNLKEITVPFVGEKVDALNSAKTLGYLFGSTEFTGGVSCTVKYNETGSSTYFVPSSLEKVTVTGDVISNYAFNGLAIKEVVLSGNVTVLPVGSFSSMTALMSFEIPANVKTIEKSCFEGSSVLSMVDFSKATSLEVIGDKAFYNCSLLNYSPSQIKTLTLPASVNTLGQDAFGYCTSLRGVDLSATAITTINKNAFYQCDILEEVALPNGVVIKSGAFIGCDKLEGDKITNIYNAEIAEGAFDNAFNG